MPQSAPSSQNKDAYMIYRVGGHLYAAPINCVLEVILTENLLPLPDASSYIAGITNFRGKVIPVIDTVKRLALPDATPSGNKYTVVFEVDTDGGVKTFGAFVDKVLSVGEYVRGEIKEVDIMPSGVSSPSYIKGVIEHDGAFVIVVSPAKLISTEDFTAVSEEAARQLWNNNATNNVSEK
ncbi:MAG: chemotaxis protein CheW [Bacteroidales bacterium]|nr:chemotaxis protein CheW [Bacteroidales bacterium]